MRKLLNNPFVSGGLALAAVALVAASLRDDKGARRSSQVPPVFEASTDYQPAEGEALAALAPSSAAAFDADAIRELAPQSAARNLFARPAPAISAADTKEPREQVLATATLRVKGVWVQGGLRYVVIDDKTLSPGQSLDRVVVERIETQGVWIGHSGQSHFIKPGESWSYQYPAPQEVARN